MARRRNTPAGRSDDARHVRLYWWLLDSPAWRSLGVGPRALFVQLMKRYNGRNNGRISYSVREAASDLGCHRNTVSPWFAELQRTGFIRCTFVGDFDHSKNRRASEWLLTQFGPGDEPKGEQDFMKWKTADDDYPVQRATQGKRRGAAARNSGQRASASGQSRKSTGT